MIKITAGESYPLYFTINQDGISLTPDMLDDLKICIGKKSWTLRSGGVRYAADRGKWYIHPTQAETLAMPVGKSDICFHFKYANGDVYIKRDGQLVVERGCCTEVF